MKRLGFWVVTAAVVSVAACGGTTTTKDTRRSGTAGITSVGQSGEASDDDDGTTPGSGAAAGTGEAGRGGSEGGGIGRGGAGIAGVAGAGGAFPNPLACDAPYVPLGGPRLDGPIVLDCAAIDEGDMLARYKAGRDQRVPRGLYYEPVESISFWRDPCSHSAEETVKRGPTDGMGMLLMSYSRPWYYEAAFCDRGVRRSEKNLNCAYFDGTQLASSDPEELAFLGSLLWWRDHANDDAVLLGYDADGGTEGFVSLCSLEITHGDFGLCDEIRLINNAYLLGPERHVELYKPKLVRTLEGDCH